MYIEYTALAQPHNLLRAFSSKKLQIFSHILSLVWFAFGEALNKLQDDLKHKKITGVGIKKDCGCK